MPTSGLFCKDATHIMVVKYWEIFYRKCVKKISNLRPSTPSCMVYGEYGKLPVQVPIDKRLVSFWRRLLNKEDSSLAHIVYMISHNLFVRDVYKAMWICRAKHMVDNCGLSYIWLNQPMMDTNHAKQLIHTRIEEVALHNWYTDISTSSMCTMYRLFKKQLNFEDYLLSCNYRERISLTKHRCATSKIPVYNQIYIYETELYTLCDINVNDNEYHYIMICPYFRQSRELYL